MKIALMEQLCAYVVSGFSRTKYVVSGFSRTKVVSGFSRTKIRVAMSVGGKRTHRWLVSRRPPIRASEKRAQLPDDCRLVSGDAPNRSWTDWVCKAVAAFCASLIEARIAGRPLTRAHRWVRMKSH
jgi:hypothetical protein